ncbi:hypothetical protein A3E17_02100 [Candidatus Amesbacteria bacterium RIFCSPHIGHO2_12_FULL_48_14]|uniref:Glycosyltransferase RgtA/B/C/D-like domain-containing protein n=2 Tax=Candidatus Amesiibacteriota TaxID=1752730 RepID=A0A1F4Z4D3_9BACT|nr:MAG: hypothetical protein A2702_02135 [Candidatus Amesbacteria bacterium RIFCSPHIGHO2_01_FULL_48_75]OGC99426.1 MAG: hypothetical protein A2W16_02775 [Candidatus Amesbacteria bacterium RBG_16_48_31]OGD01008.1 MAG: hypothetical protein A3E17_02100 [Candidatus Amesbacteria bacterium RIFCSPHIGHO2_12_FULL_48_14]
MRWEWPMRILMWGLVGVTLWLVGWRTLDPDFGWHVRMGNYILANGIPQTDPLSYTMPNFPFIDHEWLTNVLMAVGYERLGMAGLAVVFAVLTLLVVWVAIPRALWRWADAVVILGVIVFLGRAGVRPQVIDWLFLAILLRVVGEEKVWRKWKWGVVPFMILWANLHGGFAMGVAVLGIVLGVKFWEKRRVIIADAGVWILAVVGTWINPYGPRLWHEVWMQMTDSNLRWTIAEWQPFFAWMELGFWMLVALAGAIVWRYRGETAKWRWAVMGLTLAMGLSSLRHMPLFVVAVWPAAAEGLKRFYEEISGNREAIRRAVKFYILLLVTIGALGVYELGMRGWLVVKGQMGLRYPQEAINWLRKEGSAGEVFAWYGWGGYLDWKMPERRVFIDGRMPSWRWRSPDPRFADWVFKDYLRATEKGEFGEVFSKYGVEAVLWPNGKMMEPIWWEKKILEWWKKRRGEGDKKTFFGRLEEAGWKRAYEDEVAVVYVRE